eukprot:g27868.t1
MLDIPFQEVEKAALTFHSSVAGRRLQTSRSATLQAYIKSKRLKLTEINTLLLEVFASPAVASEIMNFPVAKCEVSPQGKGCPGAPQVEGNCTGTIAPFEWALGDQAESRVAFCMTTLSRSSARQSSQWSAGVSWSMLILMIWVKVTTLNRVLLQ